MRKGNGLQRAYETKGVRWGRDVSLNTCGRTWFVVTCHVVVTGRPSVTGAGVLPKYRRNERKLHAIRRAYGTKSGVRCDYFA
jgi:hypothetical protein